MDKRQEIEFDLAVSEVVKNLVGGTVQVRATTDLCLDKGSTLQFTGAEAQNSIR
jgi:hypothetical protein